MVNHYYDESFYPNKSQKIDYNKCLFVNATNDPLTSEKFLRDIQENQPDLKFKITNYGSHIGWNEEFYIDTIKEFFNS